MTETTSYSLVQQIATQIEDYLAAAPGAVVVEDGAVIFDFSSAHYSLNPDHNRCVLQMWSEERNIVRRVIGSEIKAGILRLLVQRMGQAKPSKIEICADSDRRTPSAKRAMRSQFQKTLQRILERTYLGWKVDRLTSAPDLEHSFGPAYVRGTIKRGQSWMAVVGVSTAESQSIVDSSVSIATLWLDHCRERIAKKGHVEGVVLFVPEKRAEVVRLRMAHLNNEVAKFELYEVDERRETANLVATNDVGNFATRLVHCPTIEATLERMASSIEKIKGLVPLAEPVITSSSEISFRICGLEIARACMIASNSFRPVETITFGSGAAKTELTLDNENFFRSLAERVSDARCFRHRNKPLFRMQSERWLESILVRDVSTLDENLDPRCVYAQVPAFAANDRAMIDLLAVTNQGQLAVIELKTDEDLHLPLQGLDYWARVRWHHQRGEFQKHGYFPGRELSKRDPILIMAAPSLHVHPTTDTILRYLTPRIEWKFVGLDEHWRDTIRIVFRKRSAMRSET